MGDELDESFDDSFIEDLSAESSRKNKNNEKAKRYRDKKKPD
jgi:hypothetical protein